MREWDPDNLKKGPRETDTIYWNLFFNYYCEEPFPVDLDPASSDPITIGDETDVALIMIGNRTNLDRIPFLTSLVLGKSGDRYFAVPLEQVGLTLGICEGEMCWVALDRGLLLTKIRWDLREKASWFFRRLDRVRGKAR